MVDEWYFNEFPNPNGAVILFCMDHLPYRNVTSLIEKELNLPGVKFLYFTNNSTYCYEDNIIFPCQFSK